MKKASRLISVIVTICMLVSVMALVGCNNNNDKDKGKDNTTSKTFTVTVPTGLTGGTVTADKTTVKAGENVVITATPATGYELDWIKVNNAAQEKTGNNKYEIKNVTVNITVTAAFKELEYPSMFTAFPDDKVINVTGDITYYVNASGEQEYRSDLPTLEEGATISGITATMKYGSAVWMTDFYAGNKPAAGYPNSEAGLTADYSENGYTNGILTDVTSGIPMTTGAADRGYVYEIAYTASKDGRTETRVQNVLVAKTYGLVSDKIGPVFEDLDPEENLVNLTVAEAPSAMFGEEKALKLTCPSTQEESSGFFMKDGIYFGTAKSANINLIVYNDSDTEVIFAVKGSAWPGDSIIKPHSYMLWNPYSSTYFQPGGGAAGAIFTHGYIDDKTGAMKMLQFTVVPQTHGAEATIYIGGMRGTIEEYTEFATFPEDRIISASAPFTYYVNESGEQEYRDDYPTAKNNSTVITAKATVRYFRSEENANFAYGATAIATQATQHVADTRVLDYENGIVDDITNGIAMQPGFAYYIEYTATMADSTTEKRTQVIIVWNMAERINGSFTGATLEKQNQVNAVYAETSVSPLLGSQMLKVIFDDHSEAPDARRQVWWTKSGIAVDGNQTTQRLEFLIYNPNDFAISMFNVLGSNSSWGYASIEPHTYMLWDPYSIPGYVGKLWLDGLITEANELGRIGFYFDAADGAAGELYIGEFMATLPAAVQD